MNPIGIEPRSRNVVYGDAAGRQYIANGNQWVLYNGPVEPIPPPPGAQSSMAYATHANLGADGDVYSRRYLPTSPQLYRKAGKLIRNYTRVLLPTDTSYVVGAAAPLTFNFAFPVTLLDRTGGAFNTGPGNALPVGVGPRDCFEVQFLVGQNTEKIDTEPTLASNVLGTGGFPGQFGLDGWKIDSGNVLIVNVIPLMENLRITVTVKVVEQRGSGNFIVDPQNTHAPLL